MPAMRARATLAGVVFDCDGVLVDSEPITNAVLCAMLVELGLDFDLERTMATFVGKPVVAEIATIEALTGRALAPGWYEAFVARRDDALAREVEPIAGVAQAIGRLRAAGVPIAVASGANRAKMRVTLGRTGLDAHFAGRVFGADQVERPKPAPDVYLLAMRSIGADPARTVVIEDSPTGVAAGVAAGATVLGYCERADPHRLLDAGARAVFRDMAALAPLLGV